MIRAFVSREKRIARGANFWRPAGLRLVSGWRTAGGFARLLGVGLSRRWRVAGLRLVWRWLRAGLRLAKWIAPFLLGAHHGAGLVVAPTPPSSKARPAGAHDPLMLGARRGGPHLTGPPPQIKQDGAARPRVRQPGGDLRPPLRLDALPTDRPHAQPIRAMDAPASTRRASISSRSRGSMRPQ